MAKITNNKTISEKSNKIDDKISSIINLGTVSIGKVNLGNSDVGNSNKDNSGDNQNNQNNQNITTEQADDEIEIDNFDPIIKLIKQSITHYEKSIEESKNGINCLKKVMK